MTRVIAVDPGWKDTEAMTQTTLAGTARLSEAALSRVLMAYIGAGLLFMLVPGTFLGVWNLLQVSSRESVGLVSQAWLQAHGHAQIFGWIGTFILGIGFYSLPKLRGGSGPALGAAWTCWTTWIAGVALRWTANVYGVQWRVLLPVSAVLELLAFLIFFRQVSQHRPSERETARADQEKTGFQPWVRVVMSGSLGFALTLLINAGACLYLAWRGESPALPHGFDQQFLVLVAWGFLAPFVWGFSLKWLPVFLGLRPGRGRPVAVAIAANVAGVLLALAGWVGAATGLFVIASTAIVVALRVLERPIQAAKTRGVHPSFPVFVRIAYVWLLVASWLGVAAARWDVSGGIWGASRHAFTVGFISVMVFSIGQRVLPQFANLRPLWSPRLMLAGLVLLTTGCLLRVSSEVLAYQHYAQWAWSVLPVSAIVEMAAVSCFALNMTVTFALDPSPDATIR
jgi:uncharacterized protein involved in response to NO